MDFYPVVWWIIAAVALFIVEMATASFFFLWIAAGAVVAAVVSLFFDGVLVQSLTFAVSSIVLVAASRPLAHRFGKTKRQANVDGLVGRTGIVTKDSADAAWQGTVKVEGEYWKAETENQEAFVKNGQVTVKAAHSNILVVKPL